MDAGGPIVFFDGVCNLCNGWVDFLIRRDRRGGLRFASLQGETAARLVPGARELESIAFWDSGRLYRKSGAGLRVVARLGGPWKMAAVLLLVPAWMRDGVYGWIARNRYHWFGKRESCRLPTEAEAARFLP